MKVSVILPVYNGQKFLSKTIESVKNQTFQDWELIVVNDGSTDFSDQIVRDHAKNDSRIRIITQSNLGLSSARNIGLTHSHGKFIGFLDADDKYLPECLSSISNRFQTTDEDILISGYFYFQDESILHTHRFQEKHISTDKLINANLAPPVAHFMRRELVFKIGGFDPNLRSCEDWDFWIRAGKIGAKIYTIPEVLVGYRYVPTSMSRNPRVMYDSLTEVSRRAGIPDPRLPKDAPYNQFVDLDYPNIQKKHLIRMIGVMLHQGNVNEAARWFEEELKIWNCELSFTDWEGLSSALTWKYFFGKNSIQDVFLRVKPSLGLFFSELGYSDLENKQLVSQVLKPQRFRMNHYRYGKWVGSLINRIIG